MEVIEMPPDGEAASVSYRQTAEVASAGYNGSRYFASMPSKAIQDADLARAEHLRSARENRQMNQSELARAMRPAVSPQTVQQWEKGGGIRGKYQRQVATVLGVTPEWLMFGEVNEKAEFSPSGDVRHARFVRLDGSTVATAYAAIEWRLQLVGLKFDLAEAPDVLAAALNWAQDRTPTNLADLQSALEAEIRRQQRVERALPKEDRHDSLGGVDQRDGSRARGKRGA